MVDVSLGQMDGSTAAPSAKRQRLDVRRTPMTRHIAAVIDGALLLPVPAAAQSDSEFVRWGRTHAVVLDSAGAAAATALGPLLGRARLIGIGEGVHNIHQFMGFRLALLQNPVRQHRVTALAMESGLAEGMAIGANVAGRTDTVSGQSVMGNPSHVPEQHRAPHRNPGDARGEGVFDHADGGDAGAQPPGCRSTRQAEAMPRRPGG